MRSGQVKRATVPEGQLAVNHGILRYTLRRKLLENATFSYRVLPGPGFQFPPPPPKFHRKFGPFSRGPLRRPRGSDFPELVGAGLVQFPRLQPFAPDLTSFEQRLSFPPRSGKVEAIKVRDLGPRSHEVLHKRLLRVVTSIDFRECSELGVRTEDKVDTGAGPLDFAGRESAPLIHAFGCRGGLPVRTHVEQIDEEIIRQRPGSVGEDAMFGLPEVSIQGTHAADENRHLGSG